MVVQNKLQTCHHHNCSTSSLLLFHRHDSFQLPLKPPLNLLAHKKHLKLILSLYHFNTPSTPHTYWLHAKDINTAALTLQNVPFGTYIQDPHWLSRNDVVFNRKHPNSYMQVIFRGAHWARSWSQLSKEEEKVCMMNNCRGIEGLVMELYAKRGWNFRRRLTH